MTTNLSPAELLAACTEIAARNPDPRGDKTGLDGPPERWPSESDCDYFAAREERFEQRWREGGAA